MSLTKALIVNTETNQSIPVMFNPPQYELQKTNQFAEIGIPGLGSSLLQFVSGNAQTLTTELFFDTTEKGVDVRTFTARVIGLLEINSKTHAPPRLLFLWGSLVFPCVLEEVTQVFGYFNAAGVPFRATLEVTFKENNRLQDLLGTVSESTDRTKGRVFLAGDTLQRIAAEEFGDPGLWRQIAQANNIDNPLTVQPGQALNIPALS